MTLLAALDASEKSLKKGYGNVPIPKLFAHFEKARDRLQAMTGD